MIFIEEEIFINECFFFPSPTEKRGVSCATIQISGIPLRHRGRAGSALINGQRRPERRPPREVSPLPLALFRQYSPAEASARSR